MATKTLAIRPEADKPLEHCRVFGIYGHSDAAQLTYCGLYALRIRKMRLWAPS